MSNEEHVLSYLTNSEREENLFFVKWNQIFLLKSKIIALFQTLKMISIYLVKIIKKIVREYACNEEYKPARLCNVKMYRHQLSPYWHSYDWVSHGTGLIACIRIVTSQDNLRKRAITQINTSNVSRKIRRFSYF